MTTNNLDVFTRAYLECALWLLTDGEGETIDANISDFDPATFVQALEDCADFQQNNAEDLEEAYAHEKVYYDAERAGHDFFLDREGHGAGAWDRGLGDVGNRLAEAARVYGSVDLYVGDDGRIYG